MPFGVWTQVGSSNRVLDRFQLASCQGAIFRGKNMPGYARRHASASCAEMTEPIEIRLDCGLEWAEESMSGYVGHSGATW